MKKFLKFAYYIYSMASLLASASIYWWLNYGITIPFRDSEWGIAYFFGSFSIILPLIIGLWLTITVVALLTLFRSPSQENHEQKNQQMRNTLTVIGVIFLCALFYIFVWPFVSLILGLG